MSRIRFLLLLGLLAVCAAIASSEAVQQSYYDLLNIEPTANNAAIRRAYRKLALQYHPDKVSARDAEASKDMFVKLANAYEILSDPITRKRYDYLLTQGEYEYRDVDWSQVEAERHAYRFRDPYSQLKRAEDEDLWAAIISFGMAGLVAVIPCSVGWRARWRRKQAAKQNLLKLREGQAELAVLQQELAEQETQAAEAAEAERERRRRARAEWEAQQAAEAEAEGEAEEDENKEEADSDDEEESGAPRSRQTLGMVFRCDDCNKKFKSLKQLENHNASKKHKDAVRAKERAKGRKPPRDAK